MLCPTSRRRVLRHKCRLRVAHRRRRRRQRAPGKVERGGGRTDGGAATGEVRNNIDATDLLLLLCCKMCGEPRNVLFSTHRPRMANSESVSFSPGSALNQTRPARGEPAEETCVKSPSAALYRNRCGAVHAPDTSTTAHHYKSWVLSTRDSVNLRCVIFLWFLPSPPRVHR